MKPLTLKSLITLAVIAASLICLYPPGEKIRLGLDLKGGTHLRFEVSTDVAVQAETDQAIQRLISTFQDKTWNRETILRRDETDDVIDITGIIAEQRADIEAILESDFVTWKVSSTPEGFTIKLDSNVRAQVEEDAVKQALETIRNRVDQYGVTEPNIQRETGTHRIIVQLPGVDDPQRAKELVKKVAYLQFKLLRGTEYPSRSQVLAQFTNATLPEGVEILVAQDGANYYPVDKVAAVTGRDLMNSRPTVDEFGLPAVSFTMNLDGAKKIKEFTGQHIGERLAIVLDDRVISAPNIRERLSGSNIIEGRFSPDVAADLSIQLRAGALPAPLIDIEERTIGPSLGSDSIQRSLTAGLLSLAAVFIFLLIFYKRAGINALACLVVNMIMIFGGLGFIHATLTLPGVAGLILTIGMAVDANVLIFERIKEELRNGKTPRSAVDAGFKRAFTAIFDSNLTTIIASVFLFQFGTGPIKGFAITMILGLLSNLFTATFMSRLIFDWRLGPKGKPIEKMSI